MAVDRAKVYLVGAGPGDPGLLTVKAARILAQAEAVIYDKFVSPEILALANPHATFVPARKQRGQQEEFQAEIHAWYLRLGNAAGPVVRLTSGDPLVFGRGGEELEFLTQHGFDVEVVPGVSALTAAPSLAGIPLGGFSAAVTVLPGHRQAVQEVDWPAYRHAGTLVVLMGVDNRVAIATCLIHGGRPASDPVAFLQFASTERERVLETTLEQVANGEVEVEPPAVFVIGEVVRMRTAPGRGLKTRGQDTILPHMGQFL